MLNFLIKKPETEREWSEFHRIRKIEIFHRYLGIIYAYDPNHSSIKDLNGHHFVFYMEDKIIGVVSV